MNSFISIKRQSEKIIKILLIIYNKSYKTNDIQLLNINVCYV